MDTFTQEDHDWFKTVREIPSKYRIIIDNDLVGIEDVQNDEYVYTFNSYGYEFIHALLNDMGINAEFC